MEYSTRITNIKQSALNLKDFKLLINSLILIKVIHHYKSVRYLFYWGKLREEYHKRDKT